MSEKRILITEVSGECRNLRIQQDPFDDKPGTYCAAYIHGGWEKIDPAACKTCKHEKYLTGITRTEAILTMERGFYKRKKRGDHYTIKECLAAALDELLGKGEENANK